MEGKKNIRDRWLHLRLDGAEHGKLMDNFGRTTERRLSVYARKILLGKPMIAATRDQSLQDVLAVLLDLRKDLNGIGNNYNQMLHRLHTLDGIVEVRAWVERYEREKSALFGSIGVIRGYIAKTQEKWLR